MKRIISLSCVWLLLLGFDTATQLLFKVGSSALEQSEITGWLVAVATSPWIIGGAVSYFGAFLCWTLVLRDFELSAAFPMSAVTTATVMLASWLLLGEVIDLRRWIGAGLIMAGFLLMVGEAPPPPGNGKEEQCASDPGKHL